MDKRRIMAALKDENQNKDIHWTVLENSKNLIAITNDYDPDIRFEIRFTTNQKDIKAVDVNGWKHDVAYLIRGSEYWADFTDESMGLEKAVRKVARFFYTYY